MKSVVGQLQDIVAHKAECPAQVETGLRQMLQQRRRERAVLVVAVGRGRARLGGEGYQRVRIDRLDHGQPAPDRASGDRTLHGLAERIVAACVKNDKPKLLGWLDDRQHAIKRHRLVERIDVALEDRVDRNEIVDAVDFHPVPGIVDDGDVGVACLVGEIAQGAAHVADAEIML